MNILSYIQFNDTNQTAKWLEENKVKYTLCNLRKSIFIDTIEGDLEVFPSEYIFITDEDSKPWVYTENAFLQLIAE